MKWIIANVKGDFDKFLKLEIDVMTLDTIIKFLAYCYRIDKYKYQIKVLKYKYLVFLNLSTQFLIPIILKCILKFKNNLNTS